MQEHLPGGTSGFDRAMVHQEDFIGQTECLGLVVGHVNRGKPQSFLKRTEFDPHLLAQPCVQVRQRLIEQHQPRFMHQRAGQSDALLLAAGHEGRRPVFEPFQSYKLQHFTGTVAPFGHRHAAHLQRKRDIFDHRHVRPDGVGLEHNPQSAALRGKVDVAGSVEDGLAVNFDRPPVGCFQPGEAPQYRCLSTTTRPEQRDQCHRKGR